MTTGPNGAITGKYTGNGDYVGMGHYRYADGKYYKGQWIDNKMEGYGEMFWDPEGVKEREVYRGMWSNNQRAG